MPRRTGSGCRASRCRRRHPPRTSGPMHQYPPSRPVAEFRLGKGACMPEGFSIWRLVSFMSSLKLNIIDYTEQLTVSNINQVCVIVRMFVLFFFVPTRRPLGCLDYFVEVHTCMCLPPSASACQTGRCVHPFSFCGSARTLPMTSCPGAIGYELLNVPSTENESEWHTPHALGHTKAQEGKGAGRRD